VTDLSLTIGRKDEGTSRSTALLIGVLDVLPHSCARQHNFLGAKLQLVGSRKAIKEVFNVLQDRFKKDDKSSTLPRTRKVTR